MPFPLRVVHPDLRDYATDARPIRASAVEKFLQCPMSTVLTLCDDNEGNDAAQTGNLVHSGAHAFHTTKGALADRIAASQAALDEARTKFPDGDAKKAHKILANYTADKENQDAEVPWSEETVTLRLPPDPTDPTQAPVVILGHLDQVRRDAKGTLRVHDIKTGYRLGATQTVLEYLVQQAVYTLAARATLDETIEPGSIIYTPGYEKARSKVHLPLPLTVEACKILVAPVPLFVSLIRQGKPVFRPSPENCQWCPHAPWPRCFQKFEGFWGKV